MKRRSKQPKSSLATAMQEAGELENERKRKKSMRSTFQAFLVNQTEEGFTMGIQRLRLEDLPPGDVLIQVAYAALNYKDALVCIPKGGVARTYPLVPGLELTGVVVDSSDPRFQPGDRVLAYDFGSTQGVFPSRRLQRVRPCARRFSLSPACGRGLQAGPRAFSGGNSSEGVARAREA